MIVIIGLNHKTAPLAVRERFFTDCPERKTLLSDLMALPGVQEALFLSTCNRIELAACINGEEDVVGKMGELLARSGGLTFAEAAGCLFTYRDAEAVRHLFRVTSSLDSLVMGETQILGQVKDAYRLAIGQNTAGTIMSRLLHRAFRTAKRVRSETTIAVNPVSVSFAAVELAKKIFGSLAGKKVLVIGAGEMAELTGTHLVGNGVEEVIIANRSQAQAMVLADKFHGTAIDLNHLHEALADADIVISSTGAPSYILTVDEIKQVLHRRKNRLLFLIDIAVPRDIDPAAGSLENVYLYNIDNLQDIVDGNMKLRKKEAIKAETIVEEEVAIYCNWVKELEAVPTIVALRGKAQSIVQAELARAGWLQSMDAEEQKKVEALANSIVNKLLHNPVTALKEESAEFSSTHFVALTRQLFQLDE